MKSVIVTTITTTIDPDDMKPQHAIDISTDDPWPEVFVKAVAEGALKSALLALESSADFDPDD